MIKFEKIKYKNLLSSGNIFTEIDFEHPKTLVVGSNGSGKTTIIEALIFALYGKPFRKIKKKSLINSINLKELLVELEFSVMNKKCKVIRGIKPDIFEIYVDGEKRDQEGSALDHQKYFENNLLRVSEKTMRQIVVLGSTSYTPFMRLDTKERREVIEDILDIQVFSYMNRITKDRVKNLKVENDSALHELDNHERIKNARCDHLQSLKNNNDKNVANLETKLVDELKGIEISRSSIEEYQSKIEATSLDEVQYRKNLEMRSSLRDIGVKVKSKLQHNSKELSFYCDNENCPTCSQPIVAELKQEKIKKHQSKIDELNDGMRQMDVQIENLANDIKLYEREKSVVDGYYSSINDLKRNITHHESSVSNLKKIINENDNTEDQKRVQAEIDTLDDTIRKLQSEYKNISTELKKHNVLLTMLKDDGIKLTIIKNYIPLINQSIAKYLEIMNFNAGIMFDENFECVIKSRNRDSFTYDSFSEGEKLKIDLALLFVWREISQMRNTSAINLIIFDEIGDSSLDADGFESFNSILNTFDDQNVFIISHKTEMIEKFDRSLVFSKGTDNFSQMVLQ